MKKNEELSIRKYDSIAQDYDSSFDSRFTARFKKIILEMCEFSDGEKVLDVGCGNGSLINEINQKGNIKTYGVDISPNMIEECRKRYTGISFTVSSGESIPFDDNCFGLLTICCALHHLNAPQKFFSEAHRVLKPGGILIVGEPWFPIGVRHIVDWIVSPLLRAGDNKLFSYKQLTRLFVENGFSIIKDYKKGSVQIIKGRKQ